MTEENSRTSALADRHTALGSALEDWNGMGTAWTYNTDPDEEHNAIREAAGMIDMSGLKKIRVSGPDALEAVNHSFSREMKNLQVGQSAYGVVLNEQGMTADDAIVYVNEGEFLFVHGSGESLELLQQSGQGKDVNIHFDDDLHNISLQGPLSLEILNNHTPVNLSSLAYFHHHQTTLFDRPCHLSRTGYSGERGYELYVSAKDAVAIWDNILEEGQSKGVMPASFTALDKARIEAGLLFYGYDMTNEHSPFEVGLGWTMSKNKQNYRGYDAAMQTKNQPRFLNVGLDIQHSDGLAGGETIVIDGQEVGTINSPGYSKRMQKSLALGHIQPQFAASGTSVHIKGESEEYQATIADLPFYDPQKTKTHS